MPGSPPGTKLAAVAAQPGRPIVVVNAAEGEPASVKDKALLRHNPHLVLDGAVLAAAALGARDSGRRDLGDRRPSSSHGSKRRSPSAGSGDSTA